MRTEHRRLRSADQVLNLVKRAVTTDMTNTDPNRIDNKVNTSPEDAPPVQTDDPRAFWSAAADFDEVELPAHQATGPTLERLVPSPFPRSGFPLIGFLATVYDHVADFARAFPMHVGVKIPVG